MSELITLKDYSKLPDNLQSDPDEAEKLRNCLLNLSADQVLSIPEMTETEKDAFRILTNFNGKYWTQNYIGLLQIEEKNVFIGSRFDDESFFFTQYILDRALGMNINILQNMDPGVGSGDILEQLLAFVFAAQIERAYRKGLYRRYRTYECNDSKVKGKIDITRHIRLNPLNNGKIAYSYREYTADNDVNKMIFTAYTYLQKRHPNIMKNLEKKRKTVGECITQFRNIMQPASRQEAQKLVQRERRKITHSIYHDWEEVRKTAILILRHMGIFVRDAQAEKTIHGVLINMNWVWEQYLQSILEDEIKEEYTFQPQNERETFFRIPDKESQRKLKPDLCIYKKGNKTKPALILDAKYKNAWSDAAQNGNFNEKSVRESARKSVREDCFQILAYMYRFRCNKAGIFCPCPDKNSSHSEYEYYEYAIMDEKDREEEEKFYLLPLYIPHSQESKNNSFKSFKKAMETNENKFKDQVKKILEIS